MWKDKVIISFKDGSRLSRVKCANTQKDLKVPFKVYVNSVGSGLQRGARGRWAGFLPLR